MNKRKLKRITMRFIVWNMRWMTRYFGFIARPIVRLYARQEVIACGLSDKTGKMFVIYTLSKNVKNYNVYVLQDKWTSTQTITTSNFSGNLVFCKLVLNAVSGDLYRIHAMKKSGRILLSPTIMYKQKTVYSNCLLNITSFSNDLVYIKWEEAEKYDPMIYFLILENNEGSTLSAIYTRENFWTYPLVKKASLSINPIPPPKLKPGKRYKVKLLLVNFDGWVSHMDVQTFIR